MNILLTGATGYLGSCLAQMLLAEGHTVSCIVRDVNRLNRLAPLSNKVNLVSIEQIKPCMEQLKCEMVVHTACTYARGSNTIEDVIAGNLTFPLRVLQIAAEAGVQRWINTGTGLPSQVNSYALAKKQFAQWGERYGKGGMLQFIELQLEHFYGPNLPEENFLAWVTYKLKKNMPLELTEGKQRRDFISIYDVLRTYRTVIDANFAEPYLEIPVGSGISVSLREVVEYLKERIASQSLLQFGAIPYREFEPDSCCNVEKMKSLGIKSTIYWKDGMQASLVMNESTTNKL